MITGRGLGHTGGTLDKLEALPGYTVTPTARRCWRVLRECGCAIVGAERAAGAGRPAAVCHPRRHGHGGVGAADHRQHPVARSSRPGCRRWCMDVKVGNGAFCADAGAGRSAGRAAWSRWPRGAGLPTQALITDMNQVLGRSAGNALEVREAHRLPHRRARASRACWTLTLALAARAAVRWAAWQPDLPTRPSAGAAGAGQRRARPSASRAWWPASAARATCCATHAAGRAGAFGPCRRRATACWPAMDARAVGLAVVALGGGRQRPAMRSTRASA